MTGIDFKEELEQTNDFGHSTWIEGVPGYEGNTDLFDDDDIAEVYADGSNSEGGGWVYGRLNDGRYFFFTNWADYTFWGAGLTFAGSKESIERFGLGREEREKLGIVLEPMEGVRLDERIK